MSDKLCDLCHNSRGKYVCPICGVLYCSVSCFKSEQHSQCSENFYKKCVEDELKLQQNPSCTKEISAILRRNQTLENNGPLDSDDETDGFDDIDSTGNDDGSDTEIINSDENYAKESLNDLAKRMENVDLNNEREIWAKLSLDERKEFESMIQSGGIRKILPDWEPWWLIIRPNLLITETCKETGNSSEECICPPLNVDIPPFTKLTKKIPAPNITFMLGNVLMSYAYTARWFKGKYADLPVEGITSLFALSSVIRQNKILSSFPEAFNEFEHDLKACKWLLKSGIDSSQIWKDLFHIVKGSKKSDMHFSVKACLCDIYNLTILALEILKEEAVTHFVHSQRFTGPSPSLPKVKLLLKKIIYYLSWIESYGQQLTDAATVPVLEKFMQSRILASGR